MGYHSELTKEPADYVLATAVAYKHDGRNALIDLDQEITSPFLVKLVYHWLEAEEETKLEKLRKYNLYRIIFNNVGPDSIFARTLPWSMRTVQKVAGGSGVDTDYRRTIQDWLDLSIKSIEAFEAEELNPEDDDILEESIRAEDALKRFVKNNL